MSQFNFKKVMDNITQVKRELPVLLSNDAQKYFLDAFKNQGWNGVNWEDVKRRDPESNAYKYPLHKGLSRRTMPILQGTGRLRREVSLLAGKARVTYDKYNFHIMLTLDDNMVPYGKYHNDGTDNIPKRKFMGDSPELRKILLGRINRYMNKVWQA